VRFILPTAVFFLSATLAPAVRLTAPAQRAFEGYIASLETRLAQQHARPDTYVAEREPPPGGVRIEPVNGGMREVAGGLVHHWRAAALVPGASPQDLLALLRDYNHLAGYYAPEVVSSRALRDDGATATLAMRFRKQAVVTVVLDAEFEARSGLSGNRRGYSFSRSTHIWQVEQAGTPEERRLPEGDDDGFLWRLNSYWSFEQRGDGLLMECEAVSLTRGIPAGLGWLIRPIVEALPRTSLEFTLTATSHALAANAMRRHSHDGAN